MIAPGLAAAGIETCLGSNSVGGAGPGFGVTIAGTITDRGCNLRLYSRTLYSMGISSRQLRSFATIRTLLPRLR